MLQGLNDQEVLDNRQKFGDNKIIEAEPETFLDKFKDAFGDPMIKLLIAIACIMAIMAFLGYAEWGELIGIVISVLLVTVISAKTEMSSDNEYRKLKDGAKKELCKVYRNGKIVEIEVDDVVVGDRIIIQSGDKIPADGVLCSGAIAVDNSALNGESEECKKYAIPNDFIYREVAITGDTFVDKHSLFRGAVVVNGEGVLEVKKVGMMTMMGEMAKDMQDDDVESPLKVKLSKLADSISKFGYIGAVVIAITLMIHKVIVAGGVSPYFDLGMMYVFKDLLEVLMLAVVIIVMAVPEGLPLMIAIVLMQNTSKMLQNNVLVRKPIGIETAGSLNILFSDKTGTITKGELEVVEFFDGDLKDSYQSSKYTKEYMGLCIGKNTGAMFDNNDKVIGGNATDKALLNFLGKNEMNSLNDIKVVKSQGFNSANKYSAAELENVTVYKGAPERLLGKATKYINQNGQVLPIDKDKLNAKIDSLADKAMRVLSFAYSESELIEDALPDDLVIVGFVGIRDDVRPEAKQAIKEVQNAGVQVVMITGDRKETAVAIAKDSGLIKSDDELAFTSEELNKMTDDEIKAVITKIRVIARALPTDKSRMVRIAQELNLVCGMTGDGVNDAPALKRADVGFAMGSGTDVAKEAGSIVILDDNFKSIENAILYGRTIYNNILKFIKFQLTINVAAVAVSAISPFFGVEEPLKITHILWINLVMDGLGALALGAEPALKKYMSEKPKSRTQSLVNKNMMSQVLCAGAWLGVISFAFLKLPFFKEFFENEGQHLTAYFSMFVFSAVANGFNVRSEGINIFDHIKENKGFIKVMLAIVLVQIILTFVGGEIFSCTPFGIKGWLIIIVMSLTMIPVDMLRKIIMKSSEKSLTYENDVEAV
ncbi:MULTISPECIES: calcium-translocating P-type ATPase, PMCA-type [Clostridia]|mgnify:FL=1|uniref:P-type Ca(2+) transporter n=2 Tax=Clostridia TaxID=186801 RepID=A0A8I0DNZ1_9CLOT|nr:MULTISPECIES: calcium-translocating P-type ATPase, PMCA-type [Clostridia]MBC5639972.1 calcium-translocating P-type ATPase, PMCA-type [Clostridium lentum]MBC5653759.1 calcium-translocating P-type ATPase, PMCA-type [Blautia lenta]OKZ85966.1 MAG: calcium-translocating P-type ATPase, PMCA-type [Clostridium sp. 29_15]CDB74307.1 p-type ATPase translocating [Clostridium sp. CAG:265]